MTTQEKWYEDADLVAALPARYRAYAAWSRFAGDRNSRRVVGGSFMLRALRRLSRMTGRSTIAPVRGIDGLVVLTDFADERVLEVIHEIRGENPEYRVMQALLREGDTFVDVGANYGTFSLLASRIVGGGGRVIAIEPQRGLAGLIRESVNLSGARNIAVREEAVGSRRGHAVLLVPRDDAGRAGVFEAFSGARVHDRLEVSRRTLDSISAWLPSGGRVLIKIDAEGSEFAVLDGGRELIASRRPAILVELNPWSASAAGRSTAEVLRLLADCGYERFATAEAFPEEIQLSGVPLDRQLNLVALPAPN